MSGSHAAALRPGCQAFDAARFWDAHEAWEDAWHALGGVRDAPIKGLIQFAAVQHHLQRGALGPARALLLRGRIQHHLQLPLAAWPLPTGLLLLVVAAQLAATRRGMVAHTALRLEPYLDRPWC